LRKLFVFLVVSLLMVSFGFAAYSAPVVASSKGVVASANSYASEIGAQVLEMGGNAVDAAVAISLALGVAEPYASGLGGEGYCVITLANGEKYAIDFRSKSPSATTYEQLEKDFATLSSRIQEDEAGNKYYPIRYNAKGACVPGVLAGIEAALDLAGTMDFSDLIEPSILLAENGMVVNETFAGVVSDAYDKVLNNAPNFLNDGFAWETGDIFTNSDLAETYKHLQKTGPSDFYDGELAEKIDAFMKEKNGYITKEDLANYEAIVREPLEGTYRGYDLYVPYPPVSGPQVIAVLNMLENYNLSNFTWDDPLAVHIIQQALVLEDVDRRYFISDPDFYDLPTEGFISKEYAKTRIMNIDLSKAIDPDTYYDYIGNAEDYVDGESYVDVMLSEAEKAALQADDIYEHPSTTHFSVVDQWGNAVAWTQTISSFFGTSEYMDGFFFNNEMYNFSSDKSSILALEPNMRPRTTICPTVVQKDGNVRWVIGTPGGGRIVSTIIQLLVDVIDFNMSIDEAVATPKFVGYSSYSDLRIEGGYPSSTLAFLSDILGHDISEYGYPDLFFGGPNIISVAEDGMAVGAGSIRRNGAAAAPEL